MQTINRFIKSKNLRIKSLGGNIMSHNSMGVFFSSTDLEELDDNAPNHDFYLSLIVNNKSEMCAKVAVSGEEKTVSKVTRRRKAGAGKYWKATSDVEKTEEVTYALDMDVVLTTDQFFEDRYTEVRATKNKPYQRTMWPEQDTYTYPYTHKNYKEGEKDKDTTPAKSYSHLGVAGKEVKKDVVKSSSLDLSVRNISRFLVKLCLLSEDAEENVNLDSAFASMDDYIKQSKGDKDSIMDHEDYAQYCVSKVHTIMAQHFNNMAIGHDDTLKVLKGASGLAEAYGKYKTAAALMEAIDEEIVSIKEDKAEAEKAVS